LTPRLGIEVPFPSNDQPGREDCNALTTETWWRRRDVMRPRQQFLALEFRSSRSVESNRSHILLFKNVDPTLLDTYSVPPWFSSSSGHSSSVTFHFLSGLKESIA